MAAPLELNARPLDGELPAPREDFRLPAAAEIGELLSALDRPHRFRRHRWRRLAIAAAILTVLAVRWQASGTGIAAANLSEGRYHVAGIRDENTLELPGHVEVRLLGVEPIAREPAAAFGSVSAEGTRSPPAIDFTRGLVGSGEIRLQFDRTRLDSDGRCLAYVWIDDPRGERLLNEELLRAGLCRAAPNAPCSSAMKRRLAQAAEQARRAGRGLWAKD